MKSTVADLVLSYPEDRAEETALVFLDVYGKEKEQFTFKALKDNCLNVAYNLTPEIAPREILLIIVEDEADFVLGFFGSMLSGCIPAPLAPVRKSRNGHGYERVLEIIKSGQSKSILVEETNRKTILEILEKENIKDVKVFTINTLKQEIQPVTLSSIAMDDVAYIQYTSGSTSIPKGVVLKHKSVMHNVAKMKRVFQRSESVRLVGWIPFHHDMGLVGHLFSVLYESAFAVFLPPHTFISSPHIWLEAMSNYKANTAAAPTFSFEHCVRKVDETKIGDLSSWKYAYVGSETVSLSILDEFYYKFRPIGFKRNTFKPVYGLAEATLLVAGGTHGLDEIERNIFLNEPSGKQERALVPYLLDKEDTIKIVDLKTGELCPEGESGEIWVESLSNSSGYLNDINEIADNNIVKTGDTGFIQGGFLYITGRVKQIVIVRGINYAAEDLESCARYMLKDLRTNDNTLCISNTDGTKEEFFVFQEVHRHTNRNELEKIASGIKANLAEGYGILPDRIVFIPQGLVPKTKNYKISRKQCLDDYLSGKLQTIYAVTEQQEQKNEVVNDPVVIVGMACRFPGGADSPEKFWELLSKGTDAITEVPNDRWDNDLFYDARHAVPGKVSTKWAGFTEGIDQFDPVHFDISLSEAPEIDPQQRMLLETSWRLLENAGIKRTDVSGSDTGVFIGMSTNDYLYMKIKLSPGMEGFNAYSGLGNSNSVAANRLSYFYDFKGPSLAVDTACSSSLTAFHLAAQAILNGTCTQAIAGGVNAILSPGPTITLSQFGMMSPVGRCKTFDESADGYVRAEGCGLVMLKRKSAAIKDGNTILAELSASVIGQDGHSPGITFPNGKAQRLLIDRTLRAAGLEGKAISYVEAHGTGTASGDPIEMEQIRKHYGFGTNSCYVGSVKANIGHLEAGAGIAGVIKSILMLQHKKIPPQIHIKTLNPQIQLDNTRLKIATELTDWEEGDDIRRVAISSFGFGGSLAHAILSEPKRKEEVAEDNASPYQYAQYPFVFSATSQQGLQEQAIALRDWVETGHGLSARDISYTQSKCRSDLKYRKYVIADSLEPLKQKLTDFIDSEAYVNAKPVSAADVCFLFTGQGEHYLHMGRMLYLRFTVFKNAFDRCAKTVDDSIGSGFSLSYIAFEEKDTSFWLDKYMQPVLFAIQYSLGILWQECGVMPSYLLGHSLGEYAAACIAGCFEPETGMAILLKRAELVDTITNKGMMVTIFTSADEITKVADSTRVKIAAINSDKKTVISGEVNAVAELIDYFRVQGIETYHLKTSHAFHSHLMEPIADELKEYIKQFSFKRPDKRWISSLKGKVMNEVPDANYWTEHLLNTVNFKEAANLLPKEGNIHFIEIGPGASTLVAVNDTLNLTDALLLRSLNIKKGERTEDYFFYDSVGKLYQSGINIKWDAIFEGNAYPDRIPGQKFMHKSYWMAGIDAERLAEFANPSSGIGISNRKKKDNKQALTYSLKWKEAGKLTRQDSAALSSKKANWIVIGEANAFVEDTLLKLKESKNDTFWIKVNTEENVSAKIREEFTINPKADANEWTAVISKIVNLKSRNDVSEWKLVFAVPGNDTESQPDIQSLEYGVKSSAGILIPLMQALKRNALVLPVWIVTTQSQLVTGHDMVINLKHSPVWGFCKTLFLEHPELRGGLIDIESRTEALAVLNKIINPSDERCVAVREENQYAEHISPQSVKSKNVEGTLRSDGVYIITGGLGGLGLKCADWVINKGGMHLKLISRRKIAPAGLWTSVTEDSPDYKVIQKLLLLQEKGAIIDVVAQDIRDIKGLEQICSDAAIPVRGIIHAAGVNWFSKVMDLDREEFLETLKTKVSSSWTLHELSKDMDLDAFILFSSVSALWGSVELSHYTAANHFMDMLSLYRKQMGLPSLCINWGPWAEVGMSAEDKETDLLQKLGFNLMPPDVALKAMEEQLFLKEPLSLITNMDWKRFGTFIDFSLQPSLFSEVSSHSNEELNLRNNNVKLIQESSPDAARELIENAVRLKLRNVMLIDSFDKIEGDQRFNFLGMDSLMAIHFVAELEQYFCLQLPTTLAYNYPTINAVSDHIFSLIYKFDGSHTEKAVAKDTEVVTETIAAEKTQPEALFKTLKKATEKIKFKIYCFPYLGTGSSVYEKWAAMFGNDVELIAIQPPGREERSDIKPFISMPDLMDSLLQNFEEPEEDYIFFGHSFGALTAYEFYTVLKQRERKLPFKLFLSACEAPIEPSETRLHELDDSEFIEEMVIKYENSQDINERKKALSSNPDLVKADLQILETYLPGRQPVDVPLIIIAGKDDKIADVEKVKSWIHLAENDFSIHFINGGHELIKNNSHELVAIIKSDVNYINKLNGHHHN